MTGPEHYREAERLLAEGAELPEVLVHINREPWTDDEAQDLKDRVENLIPNKKTMVVAPPVTVDMSATLAAAQIHATLALAAATALPAVYRWLGDEGLTADREWTQVTS